jgi:hypothetical protein
VACLSARGRRALSPARLAPGLLYGQLAEGVSGRRLPLVGGGQIDQRGAAAAVAPCVSSAHAGSHRPSRRGYFRYGAGHGSGRGGSRTGAVAGLGY